MPSYNAEEQIKFAKDKCEEAAKLLGFDAWATRFTASYDAGYYRSAFESLARRHEKVVKELNELKALNPMFDNRREK